MTAILAKQYIQETHLEDTVIFQAVTQHCARNSQVVTFWERMMTSESKQATFCQFLLCQL